MSDLIKKLYHSPILGRIFHTLDYCLQKELKDCESVLDLGCGSSSPLQYCKNVKYSVGVEAFQSYLKESKRKKIHSKYMSKKITELDFPENSFDAVLMIEVLEHLPEEDGMGILRKIAKWAKKKIIISSPNGFIPQKEIDNNLLQKHLSGWDYEKMRKLEFKSYGLAGLKLLRQEVQSDTMGDDLKTSVRFKHKFFWFIVATSSQIFTYFFPKYAFGLFSIKKIKDER